MFEGFDTLRVAASGVELFCRVGGSGPPLALLHGYPQTHACWHAVAPRLAERFTVVVPDLPGCGLSGARSPDEGHRAYSKRRIAVDVVALMAHFGHERFALAGHDRGARVGYRLALDQPDRVTRLALLDILPTYDMFERMDAERAQRMYHWLFLAQPHPLPERLIERDAEFYLRHTLHSWVGDPAAFAPEAMASYVAAFRNPSVIRAACEDYRAGWHVDRADDTEDLAAGRKITCPVLVMWGERFGLARLRSPIEVWERWAADVRGRALPTGHFLPEEAPRETADALLEFLSGD
jgi:haloacetate dehalogenase